MPEVINSASILVPDPEGNLVEHDTARYIASIQKSQRDPSDPFYNHHFKLEQVKGRIYELKEVKWLAFELGATTIDDQVAGAVPPSSDTDLWNKPEAAAGSSGNVMGDLVKDQLAKDPSNFFRLQVTVEKPLGMGQWTLVDAGGMSVDVDEAGGTMKLPDGTEIDGLEVTRDASGNPTSFTIKGVTLTNDGRGIFRVTSHKVSITEGGDLKNIGKTFGADFIRLLQIAYGDKVGPHTGGQDP